VRVFVEDEKKVNRKNQGAMKDYLTLAEIFKFRDFRNSLGPTLFNFHSNETPREINLGVILKKFLGL
jgi:hypothetical protein